MARKTSSTKDAVSKQEEPSVEVQTPARFLSFDHSRDDILSFRKSSRFMMALVLSSGSGVSARMRART